MTTALPDKTRPLISIITPTFNAGSTLAETLRSVEGQIDERTEHLLVDACSSDRTLEIARGSAWLQVSSEPDRGIYDGMNKGARMARGEWLLFLQADDWLPEGCLNAYLEAIGMHPAAHMICGGAEALRKGSHGWEVVWSIGDDEHKKLSIKNIVLGEPMINARLIRRDAFHRLGGFSTEYSLASDRDFLLRAAQAALEQREIEGMTYRYRWHAGSSTMTEGNALSDRLLDENLAIASRHLRVAKGIDRDALIRWNTRLTLQGAMNALEKRCHRLGGFMATGFKNDFSWPVVFFCEICRSLPGFVRRGFRSRSRILQKEGSHG